MSILIVDDNPTNLVIIEKILKHEGYGPTVKMNSALELLEYLNQEASNHQAPDIDLILMDLMMPEIDGIEACRIIQQVDVLKDIPIIIVTAFGESGKLAEALDAGAVDFVTKPINKIELLARIRVSLRLKKEKDWHKERDQKISHELELARQVQQSVLSKPLTKEGLNVDAVYMPSFALAGDLYAWGKIDSDRSGIILLDVMGHGISSSLVGMYIYSLLRDLITQSLDPAEVIRELNRHIHKLHNKDSFTLYYFTTIYLVVNTAKRQIEYVNAGHPPGFLFRQENGETVMLDKGSCAVGITESMDIETGMLSYNPGDTLFVYTDGLMESYSKDAACSIEKLLSDLKKGQHLPLDRLMDTLIPRQNQVEGEGNRDDICMVRLQFEESEEMDH